MAAELVVVDVDVVDVDEVGGRVAGFDVDDSTEPAGRFGAVTA